MTNISNNTWYISEDLNSTTVPNIIKSYNKSLPDQDWSIDLSKCKHIDSSGLALLVKYFKYAKANNIKLKVVGLNKESLLLAKVHGISELLLLTEVTQ
ncbi:STAS domain-containing protein [Francisella sp. Scap27]|uniref:STAS domain-containing protein n=1 Tax=Francisella sp. Scap27 TaxID=2589986 RepID=UPI0015C1A804|nr:STAS domain-containing protein [Francisella sp. Scap27]QLE79557.1 STAS domain-containing protein [Francisella sp. Scap27]